MTDDELIRTMLDATYETNGQALGYSFVQQFGIDGQRYRDLCDLKAMIDEVVRRVDAYREGY